MCEVLIWLCRKKIFFLLGRVAAVGWGGVGCGEVVVEETKLLAGSELKGRA